MSELPRDVTTVLARHGYAFEKVRALKGDLSTRRYFRLAGAAGPAILMLMPASDRVTLGRVVDRTRRLADAGLSVPAPVLIDAEAGLGLFEDFGDRHLADMLREGDDAETSLSPVIEALKSVRRADMAELEAPDAEAFVSWIDLAFDWLPGADAMALSELRAMLIARIAPVLDAPRAFMLRDLHAENVIWLEAREGIGRAGLIDFQDALAFHPLYDVASLLRDARIDIPEDVVTRLLARAAADLDLDRDAARLAFDLFTIQRNLRIAAIFNRSARSHGKPAHLRHLPRVLSHIRRAAAHPDLAEIAAVLPAVLDPQMEGA